MTVLSFRRRRRHGRHVTPQAEVSVTDALRALPPEPVIDPLRDTGEIPVLADAQRALIEQRAVPVPVRPGPATLRRVADGLRAMDTHPFEIPARTETARICEDERPVRPRLQPLSPRTPRAARPPQAWEQSLVYPAPGAAADYRRVMHVIDRITGTSSPRTWAPEIESGRAA